MELLIALAPNLVLNLVSLTVPNSQRRYKVLRVSKRYRSASYSFHPESSDWWISVENFISFWDVLDFSSPNLTQKVTRILNYSGLTEYSIRWADPFLTWQPPIGIFWPFGELNSPNRTQISRTYYWSLVKSVCKRQVKKFKTC